MHQQIFQHIIIGRNRTGSKTAAIRITRSRKAPQVSPNVLPIVYVGRPGVWGNPFKHVKGKIYINAAWRRKIVDPWVYVCPGNQKTCVSMFACLFTGDQGMLLNYINAKDYKHWYNHFSQLNIFDLKNKNLSCWCKIHEHCHADVLMFFANIPIITPPKN